MDFDYSKLKFRVDLLPLEKDAAKKFPELKQRFTEHISALTDLGIPIDKMIRFCVLCYCESSPLVMMIDDVLMRKKKALELIDFQHDELSGVIKEKVVAHAVIQFMKFENHSRHMNLMAYHETMAKCHADIMTTKGTERKQTLEAMEKLQGMIDKLASTHYKDDEELDDFSDSFQILEKRNIFPEEQAA